MPSERSNLREPVIGGLAPGQLRLLTKVARLYHEHGMRQPQIAEQLHISQPRVSRLLKQAVELGIVRTTVVTPAGVHAELEEQIERRFGLRDVVVADPGHPSPSEQSTLQAIGAAAAVYLETTLTGGDRIGISSWSSTLLATVDAMRPRPTPVADQVVQIIGGVGNSTSQVYATRIADRLAVLTGAEAVFLPAPGLAASPAAREALMADPHISDVLATYDGLTMVLAGVGSLEPSPLLVESGNAIADAEQEALRKLGAVGDICLRFFDEKGELVKSALDDRVLGIDAETLRSIPRRVAIAGGTRKYTSIRAALRGGWVDVLVTDLGVARRLAEEPDGQ
ncbi:sugar-binding transcriptional regulator [Microbispora sp. NBRC 16548]|uniref:sugar-binding transcriptional regulator n=1 Tax=Microbispora sp. NBRC 16548 TaxID=3030994 RepID=UPI0017E1062D|nr:sugar-binding transcriptional regulator [Microbispora sp. NBRC 16548]GLX11310.1 DNA-binding transcriptional regulator [Microbispora sp. NBRC 16548]